MCVRLATLSAFTFVAIASISSVAATPLNATSSIAPAAAASSLVASAEFVIQDGRCYWAGNNKFPRAVDMSRCKHASRR